MCFWVVWGEVELTVSLKIWLFGAEELGNQGIEELRNHGTRESTKKTRNVFH